MGIYRDIKYYFRRIRRIKRLDKSFVKDYSSFSQEKKKMVFPKIENPQVSIIIPFFNQRNYTWNCLTSIFQNIPKVNFEIVLVNDNSSENTDFENIENIRIIKNEENLGFLRSVNKAIKSCKSQYIYLLNNDTIVQIGFLDELLYVFNNFEDVGAVGSMLINSDGSLQEAGSVFMKDCNIAQVFGNKKIYYPEFNYIYQVDYCSGCSLLFERVNSEGELNLFDEQFAPAYFEETDLCFRLRYDFGKKIYYTPFSKVVHFNGVSYDSNIEFTATKQELFDKNLELFKRKWQKQIDSIQAESPQQRILELCDNKSAVFYNTIVPEYDKNSGELRLSEIMKGYKKSNYFVALIARENRIDIKYNEYFQRAGICVYYEHEKHEDRVNFIQRLNLKKPLSWFYAVDNFIANYERAIKANHDTILVYDMVDIHHLRLQRAMEMSPQDSNLKKEFEEYLQREKSASHKADLIVAISEEEEKYMSSIVAPSKLVVISNVHYPKVEIENIPDFNERNGILFVGSIHTPNIDAVHFLVNDIMPFVWEKNPDIPVNIVGNVINRMEPIKHEKIFFHGYVPEMTTYLLENKIMVAPLRYGAGVKGKIGQAFEYFLPVVTTSIGAEGMDLKNNENVLIADEKEDFAQRILELYSDYNLWKKLQNKSIESLYPFSREILQKKIKEIDVLVTSRHL